MFNLAELSPSRKKKTIILKTTTAKLKRSKEKKNLSFIENLLDSNQPDGNYNFSENSDSTDRSSAESFILPLSVNGSTI